ncbi:MAG: chemotaxis protein CheW [Candidatus Heimdallarchaeaceae archaeon]
MTEKVLIFKLENMLYSLDSYLVKEILSNISITKTPNTQSYLLGSISQGGEVLPVIDLEFFFYGSNIRKRTDKQVDSYHYLVVRKFNSSVVLRVHDIVGNFDIVSNQFFDNISSVMEMTNSFKFKSSFLFRNEIVIQIDLSVLFETITEETKDQLKQFIEANNELELNDISELYEKKEEYNIQLIKDTSSKTEPITLEKSTGNKLTINEDSSVSGILIKVKDVMIFIQDSQIEEVFSKSKLTYEEVPKDVPALSGAVNYRGDVLSVINLKNIIFPQFTSVKDNNDTESEQVVIVHDRDQRFAMTFDEVQKWIRIKSEDIRKILYHKRSKQIDYVFKGAFIDENNNIVFMLNISWIINNHQNPTILQSSYQRSIFFDNPVVRTLDYEYIEEYEGLLLRSGDHHFVLDTDIISTIRNEDEESYVSKSFKNKSIVGIGIHNQIHPVIDFFNFFYGQDTEDKEKYNKVVITIEDTKSKQELSLIVDEIIAKVTRKDLTVLQKGVFLNKDICDDIYNGFFAFSSILGGILNSKNLLEKLNFALNEEFGKKPTVQEFEELISEAEKEKLHEFRERQKEIEFMLFDDTGKERIQYLVFSLNDIHFGINPSLIISVIDADTIVRVEEENNPVLGTLSFDDQIIPIVDVVNLLFSDGELETKIDDNLFLLLKGEASESIYALPILDAAGVFTTYLEDLTIVEENETFNDKYNICQNYFTDKKFETPIYGMDNSFIHHFETNQTLTNQIKKIMKN